MARIFISYRRDDSPGHAGRLYDHLEQRFGKKSVFADVTSITGGRPWREAIEEAIGDSTFLLAVIGRRWVEARDEQGEKRLGDPDDVLRQEIARGLVRGAAVIPVLVNGARLPGGGELPEDLRPLADLQAVELRDDRWDADVEHLVRDLVQMGFEPEVFDPTPPNVWRLKILGAGVGGLCVVMVAAGFLSEGSYARLLGLRFTVSPGVAPVLSGAQFLIDLAPTLLGIVAVGASGALLAAGVNTVLRRLVPAWNPRALLSSMRSRTGALLAAQVTAGIAFVVFSLTAFADLMPLAGLPTGSGIASAPLDLIARGPELYRTAVVSVLAVCLTQAGLEYWRLRSRRSGSGPPSRARSLSFLLSIPLDLICLIELLLLPVGHGLLKLPSSRRYTATVVTFKESAVNEDLRGRTLLLLAMSGRTGASAFFCPDPPQTWSDFDATELASTREARTGTILELVSEFEHRKQCEAGDLRPASSVRSGT